MMGYLEIALLFMEYGSCLFCNWGGGARISDYLIKQLREIIRF